MKNKTRWILFLLAIGLLLGISIAWATTRIDSYCTAIYKNIATGEETRVESNHAVVNVTLPPTIAGVPAKALPGQVNTLTYTCDIGDNLYGYTAELSLFGGAYVAGSAVFTGTTGAVISIDANKITVRFDPIPAAPQAPNLVSCSYDVKW